MKAPHASLIQKGATAAAKLTKISPTQDLVERADRFLAGINHYRLPDGPEATRVLDLCETFDGIRTKLRAKAKALLSERARAQYPVTMSRRSRSGVLSRRYGAGFRRSVPRGRYPHARAIHWKPAARPIWAPSASYLAEQNPDWTADELEHVLNRVLADLIHFEKVLRLSRSKDRQFNLSLDDD